MMNNINSYARKKLNNRPPHQLFSLLYGNKTLKRVGAVLIAPSQIILKPELLKNKFIQKKVSSLYVFLQIQQEQMG